MKTNALRPGGADRNDGPALTGCEIAKINRFFINGWPLWGTKLNILWVELHSFDFAIIGSEILIHFQTQIHQTMPKPNTFSQMYIHVVFAVKGRTNSIWETHREQVQRYITGIVQNRKVKVLATYC